MYSDEHVGATGEPLKDVLAIGIGGSFLGPLFVHTALQTDPEVVEFAKGHQLRFLANVDPIDVARNIIGLDPETTCVVVVSKTFTTAETMLKARALWEWISSALSLLKSLALILLMHLHSGISAGGVLPLSLQYGFLIVENQMLSHRASIDSP
ncbi:glucose-6-phosphate isomerase, cytosolic-like isoform X2 [Durio zibethinus]|uniref:Glucose-6-phosphate isomerase, cytosolic-like isoform X2 n=1 Tax=Durio zibethinus TaxID=66656 RepID=A0A6P6ARK9_DURZI|nr:glucose-6-phosphate isomerase, cytosolic-like isoform X2 [Durio zibethinus]